MSTPSPIWFPWLRKLSVHLWVFANYVRISFLFVPRIAKAITLEQRNRIFTTYIQTLLDAADILIQSSPKNLPVSRWKRRSLLRSWYYSHIVSQVAILPRDWQSGLSPDDLLRIVRLGELALQHYESGGAEIIDATRKWKRFGAIAGQQMRCIHHAFFHTSLASLYLRVNAGDLSRNLESAFTHYRVAADILEHGNLPVLSLYAAAVWSALGAACLNYPTENRADYAKEALVAFGKAKEITALHSSSLQSSTPEIWNDQFLSSLSFIPRAKYAARFSMRLAKGGWKMTWRGVPDPTVVGTLLPLFMLWVDWQLGVAYRQRGQLEKAVEHFELALQGPTKGTEDFESLRAAVEVDKGCAYLEAQSGERRKNLDLSIQSFKNALAGCVKDGSVRSDATRTYALALVGDARLYFALHALGAIKTERYKETLPVLTNQLRAAARIARIIAMPELVQEALFLLGKGYELQGDNIRAYRALALASRVADRLERRARTPRLVRYLVGTRTELDKLLVRVALLARSYAEKEPSKEGHRTKPVPLHSALRFAERGRAVFLATQLRSLELLPEGATEKELRDLFERRRLWHQAELKLLEQESTPITDENALITLRERRNIAESRYFTELERMRKQFGDPHYDPDQPVLPARLEEIRAVVRGFSKEADTALVEYYFTEQDLVAFVLLPTYLHCAYVGISRDELEGIETRWQESYGALRSPKHWESGYLLQVLNRLKPAVEAPANIIAKWETETGRRIRKIIIVPHRFLHLIPLHAAELPKGGMWCDSVSIQYAPSASVLWQLLRSKIIRNKQPTDELSAGENNKAVCISYASTSEGQPLVFNTLEAREVAQAMNGVVLTGPEATPSRVIEEIRGATYIHFSCHGRFGGETPLEGGLKLAPEDGFHSRNDSGDRVRAQASCEDLSDALARSQPGYTLLTLAEIFRRVHLTDARLVVLSACETGLTKIEKLHEENIGLPAGFLYAGAKTVISTLWRVPDIATWLLMRSLAREIASGVDPSGALCRAQHELRSVSLDHVLQEIAQAVDKEQEGSRRERMIEEAEGLHQKGEPYPFAGPYWWAGFTVNGL